MIELVGGLPERVRAKAVSRIEKALDLAVLLDTNNSDAITEELIFLLTEVEQLLVEGDVFDGEELPEQLELDLGDNEDELDYLRGG